MKSVIVVTSRPQSNQRGIETRMAPKVLCWRLTPQSNQRGIETESRLLRAAQLLLRASIEPAWD